MTDAARCTQARRSITATRDSGCNSMQWWWRGPDFSCTFAKLHFYGYFQDCAIPHLKYCKLIIWLRLNENAGEESERVGCSISHRNILICNTLAVEAEVNVNCCMLCILQNCKTIASYCTVAADGKWSHLDFLTLSSAMQGEFCTATSSRQVVEIPNWWSVDVAKRLVTSQLTPPPYYPTLLSYSPPLLGGVEVHNLQFVHDARHVETWVWFIATPPPLFLLDYILQHRIESPLLLDILQSEHCNFFCLHKYTVSIEGRCEHPYYSPIQHLSSPCHLKE